MYWHPKDSNRTLEKYRNSQSSNLKLQGMSQIYRDFWPCFSFRKVWSTSVLWLVRFGLSFTETLPLNGPMSMKNQYTSSKKPYLKQQHWDTLNQKKKQRYNVMHRALDFRVTLLQLYSKGQLVAYASRALTQQNNIMFRLKRNDLPGSLEWNDSNNTQIAAMSLWKATTNRSK